MANEMITQLPTVANATLSDIIYAVQGFISPSSPGTSVQQTLQQVLSLMVTNTILSNAGNPNGAVAGQQYQLCWDLTNKILYVCTTTGTSVSAVWTNFVSTSLIAGTNIGLVTTSAGTVINAAGSTGITWNLITGTSATMSANNGYVTNNSGLVTLTLPTTAPFGSIFYVEGLGTGGWKVAQNTGQQINIGSSFSTSGVSGFIASTNKTDSVVLLTTVANTSFTTLGGVQGNITVN